MAVKAVRPRSGSPGAPPSAHRPRGQAAVRVTKWRGEQSAAEDCAAAAAAHCRPACWLPGHRVGAPAAGQPWAGQAGSGSGPRPSVTALPGLRLRAAPPRSHSSTCRCMYAFPV
ncbi:putative uncharacterized protein ASB16-AS1 [Schistocerca gregaria]|uniref:putative uncharacterized protein ASB16-AS1 n=1 Tax=Schistocerca gregaria TaxID=7010 RepID=UPI00211EF8EF|nr:putative uncharacterized protein ASB16-AS1 [Schistocerca gregaria]XP_049848175.1 putative uncharacterized protein ASB16-AS1 [Schistocerca gregaria]